MNEIVVLTGVSGGLGRVTASSLLKDGYRVIGIDICDSDIKNEIAPKAWKQTKNVVTTDNVEYVLLNFFLIPIAIVTIEKMALPIKAMIPM